MAIRQTAFAAAVSLNLLIAPKVPAQAIVPAVAASPPSCPNDNGRNGRSRTCHCHWLEHTDRSRNGPQSGGIQYRPGRHRKTRHSRCNGPTDVLPQEAGGAQSLNAALAGTAPFNSTCAACCPKKPWCCGWKTCRPWFVKCRRVQRRRGH